MCVSFLLKQSGRVGSETGVGRIKRIPFKIYREMKMVGRVTSIPEVVFTSLRPGKL